MDIIKDIHKANNFILGYLIFFISCLFMPYYFAIFPVMIVAAVKELLDMRKSKPFDMVDFGHIVAGMIPALLTNIFR
jgi:hypothetical protein